MTNAPATTSTGAKRPATPDDGADRIWELAARLNAIAAAAGDVVPELATEVRCALARSGQLPPVEDEDPSARAKAAGHLIALMPPGTVASDDVVARCLADCHAALSPTERAATYVAMAIARDGAGRHEWVVRAVAAVRSLKSSFDRSRLLARLAPALSEEGEAVFDDVLTLIDGLSLDTDLGRLLVTLAPHLPPYQIGKALRIARTRNDGHLRQVVRRHAWNTPFTSDGSLRYEDVFVGLTPPSADAPVALTMDYAIRLACDAGSDPTLVTLAQQLPESQLPLMVRTLEARDVAYHRGDVIRRLARFVAGSEPSAVKKLIGRIDDRVDRAEASLDAARRSAPGDWVRVVADVIDAADRPGADDAARLLVAVAPLVDLPQAARCVARAASMPAPQRTAVFVALARRRPDPTVADVVLEACALIVDEGERAETLCALAPVIREASSSRALTVARSLRRSAYRARAVRALAPAASPEVAVELLAIAEGIARPFDRAEAICSLFPRLPADRAAGVTGALLADVNAVSDEGYRSTLLQGVAAVASADAFDDLLAAAARIELEPLRAATVSGFHPHLPPAATQHAAAVLATVTYAPIRAVALVELSCVVPDESQRQTILSLGVETAKTLPGRRDRADAFQEMVARTPAPDTLVLREALAAAAQVRSDGYVATALARLLPVLPTEMLEDALAVALRIGDPSVRADAVAGLAPALWSAGLGHPLKLLTHLARDSARCRLICDVAPFLDERAAEQLLEPAGQLKRAVDRAEAVAGLMPRLSVGAARAALIRTAAIADQGVRACAIDWLIPGLPDPLLPDLLAALAEFRHADLLVKLLPRVVARWPDATDTALALARAIADPRSRCAAFAELCKHFPPDRRPQVLRECLECMPRNAAGAAILAAIVPLLEGPSLPIAASIATEIGEPALALRIKKAGQLTDPLEPAAAAEMLARWVRAEAAVDHPEVAPPAPPPPILDLDRIAEVQAAADRIAQLARACPTLPENQLPRALSLVLTFPAEHDRVAGLTALRGWMPPPLLLQAAEHFAEVGDPDLRAEGLRAVIERVVTLGTRPTYDLVHGLFVTLAGRGRLQLFRAIACLGPVVLSLGGERTLREVLESIHECAGVATQPVVARA